MSSLQESLKPMRFISCNISGKMYCVKMSWVRGIKSISECNITRESENNTLWLSDGTDVLPVVDLSQDASQFYNGNYQPEKVLMCKTADGYFGICVDSIESIFEVGSDQVFPLPHMIGGTALNYFDGVVHYQNDLTLCLAPSAIYAKYYAGQSNLFLSENSENPNYSLMNLSTTNNRQKKIVIFNTVSDSSLLYGLSITQISQVLQLSPILPVPGSLPYIQGILQWRGIILPVIDLSLYIENKKSDIKADGRILVVRLTTLRLLIAVSIQPQILIQALPAERGLTRDHMPLKPELIYDQFKFEDKTVVIPKIDTLAMRDDELFP